MPDFDERYFEPREEIREVHRDSASVEITKGNLWKNNRGGKKFADKFSVIIKNIGAKAPATILLEGEWGTGKTHFLKSFQIELKTQSYRAIYFDAYAEDFSTDPLLAICGQLWEELKTDKSTPEEWKNTLKDMMSVAMSKKILWNAVNAIGILTGKEKLTELLINTITTTDKNIFDQYIESRNKLEKLKKEISDLVEKNKDQEGDEGKPLVFIIDELDRCRPTFALELLERVKHLFQVPGLIFVFGANKESLMKSIKSEYGNQDTEYLQKFFDLELKLPNHIYPSSIASKYQDFIINYEILIDDNGVGCSKLFDTPIITRLYYPLMDIMEITLRQAQRAAQMFLHCLSTLSTSISTEKPYDHKIIALICLILLKVGRPKLYVDFTKGNATCENVLEEIVPLIEKWSLSELTHYSKDELETCRCLFTRAIYSMANEEEKKGIMEYSPPKSKYIEDWGSINEELLNRSVSRSEIVAMLENLDCQNPFSH